MSRMRQCQALMIGLGLAFAAGCAHDEARSKSEWFHRFQSNWTDPGSDTMTMEFAYLRRSIDDPYLNSALWHEADENCVPLEKRPLLAANGLRVGLISGTVPAKLQHWLCSDGQSDAHRLITRAGHVSFLPLGENPADLKFSLHEDAGTRMFEMQAAQCGLGVRLSVAENGDTVVQLEPCVRFGALGRLAQPAPSGSGLEVTGERSEEKFPILGWEQALTPSDYIIVGGLAEKPGTLGYACFVQPDTKTQNLLVIRTARAAPSIARTLDSIKTTAAYRPRPNP
jgi:hypothetical protein